MQCTQVEERLNQLLDQRLHWAADPALVAHCARCLPCLATADAFAALDRAVSMARTTPELRYDFSERVLAEVRSVADYSKQSKTLPPAGRVGSGHQPWMRWLIAASLLVVAIPTALLLRSSSLPTIDHKSATSSTSTAPAWPFQGELAQLLEEGRPSSEDVWRSTGRGIAALPHQVRRAAALSESAQLTSAIRPVAVAWHALRRVLPGESIRSEPAEGETGYFKPASIALWA